MDTKKKFPSSPLSLLIICVFDNQLTTQKITFQNYLNSEDATTTWAIQDSYELMMQYPIPVIQ